MEEQLAADHEAFALAKVRRAVERTRRMRGQEVTVTQPDPGALVRGLRALEQIRG
jgi:hypothetical protein